MKKYYYLAAFVSLLVLSWLIQTQSSRFYAQPIIEVQTVQVTADQQQIQGILRNGEEAGVLRTATTAIHAEWCDSSVVSERTTAAFAKRRGWLAGTSTKTGWVSLFLLCLIPDGSSRNWWQKGLTGFA